MRSCCGTRVTGKELCVLHRELGTASPLQLCWGHFHGAGAAQQPLCQAAKTEVGNKAKSRDQHLGRALSGQAFPLRKRAAKGAVSKDPSSLVWIRAPLAATSSVKLSPAGIRTVLTGKELHRCIVAARSSNRAVQTCSHPPSQQPSLLGAAL